MALRTEERSSLEFIFKSLFAGGIAGMCSKTAVAPLDRIKILLQAHNKHYKHLDFDETHCLEFGMKTILNLPNTVGILFILLVSLFIETYNLCPLGVFSGLQHIVHKETFLALYKGNGAQMVRIFPYAATQFTAFEFYKKMLTSALGSNSHIGKFLAGSSAGVTAVTLTYPLDTIRARLAFQVTGEHVYTGILHTALSIFKEEGGLRALYRGFLPTVCGMIPYAGFSFYCFEMLKYICMKYIPQVTCDTCSRNTGGLVLLMPAKLLCGGLAGAVAQSVSYPLDVTRRRMQLAMMNPETRKFGMGMMSTIFLIYKENGVFRGLYRGMSINYLRAVPMVAVSFTTYEILKQMLNLDTGMKL